jgi:hypothetical protein
MIGTRYVGIYTYTHEKTKLPTTNMVAFDVSEDVVRQDTFEHLNTNKNDISQYHISEYESNWDLNDRLAPIKIRQFNLT